jgi:hypothetical protein
MPSVCHHAQQGRGGQQSSPPFIPAESRLLSSSGSERPLSRPFGVYGVGSAGSIRLHPTHAPPPSRRDYRPSHRGNRSPLPGSTTCGATVKSHCQGPPHTKTDRREQRALEEDAAGAQQRGL